MNQNYYCLILFLLSSFLQYNPMEHTLGIFHRIENPFMNEVY